MRPIVHHFRGGARLPAALRDDSGTTLVEFAIVMAVFLLLLFGLIDFGRLGYSWVTAEKAMQRAVRIAAVRPPICAGVPDHYGRPSSATSGPEFGTSCNATGYADPVCGAPDADPNTAGVQHPSCTGDQAVTTAGQATATEIWSAIEGLMPAGSSIANVRFTYSFDPDLGFLGGPYVPVVTAELENATFAFVNPLAGFAAMAGATGSTIGSDLPMPRMSVSLPGEDLNDGVSG